MRCYYKCWLTYNVSCFELSSYITVCDLIPPLGLLSNSLHTLLSSLVLSMLDLLSFWDSNSIFRNIFHFGIFSLNHLFYLDFLFFFSSERKNFSMHNHFSLLYSLDFSMLLWHVDFMYLLSFGIWLHAPLIHSRTYSMHSRHRKSFHL